LFERVQFFLLAAAGMVAGGCVVVQQALNATLRSELSSSAFWAAFVSYTAGVLTLADYNRRVKEFTPTLSGPKYRNKCESWLKYHADTPTADEIYRIEQATSRRLKDQGAGLRRVDIDALRT